MLIFICVEGGGGGGSLPNMQPIYDRFDTPEQTKKNCAKTHKNDFYSHAERSWWKILSSSLK